MPLVVAQHLYSWHQGEEILCLTPPTVRRAIIQMLILKQVFFVLFLVHGITESQS